MKRRQKELGLYNILGMGKSNIASVLFFETLFVALITLVFGLALGVLLSKLTLLLLCKLIGFAVPYGFEISVKELFIAFAFSAAFSCLSLLQTLCESSFQTPSSCFMAEMSAKKNRKPSGSLQFSESSLLAEAII